MVVVYDSKCVWYMFCRMVVQAAKTYQRALEQGLKQSDAWNQSGCDWVAAANVRIK